MRAVNNNYRCSRCSVEQPQKWEAPEAVRRMGYREGGRCGAEDTSVVRLASTAQAGPGGAPPHCCARRVSSNITAGRR